MCVGLMNDDSPAGWQVDMPSWHEHTVAVIMTVKNDPVGCATTLSSLTAQTRTPDEIIVVDGGSTEDTLRLIRQYSSSLPQLRLKLIPFATCRSRPEFERCSR